MSSVRFVLDGGQDAESQGNWIFRDTTRPKPAILVSFAYLGDFVKEQAQYWYRDWALDSGAFTAQSSGTPIDHAEYLRLCKELLAKDRSLAEVFALDVIGDHDATLKNVETAWAAGVPAIPTYHVGEPEEYLKHLAATYPKIALGGAVGYRRKGEWAKRCFSLVWPKAIHGLGYSDEADLLALPWHSVDASTWKLGPCKYGRWRGFWGDHLRIRGSDQDLRAEVDYYLRLERQMMERWGGELRRHKLISGGGALRLEVQGGNVRDLATLAPPERPTVRLAIDGAGAIDQKTMRTGEEVLRGQERPGDIGAAAEAGRERAAGDREPPSRRGRRAAARPDGQAGEQPKR